MQNLIAKLGPYGGTIIMFAIWIAVFYFLLILPNKKRRKQQQQMFDALKEGVEIVTIGGIKGTVVAVLGDFIEVKVDKGVKLTLRKSAVSTIL